MYCYCQHPADLAKRKTGNWGKHHAWLSLQVTKSAESSLINRLYLGVVNKNPIVKTVWELYSWVCHRQMRAFLLALLAAVSQTASRWFAFPLPVFQDEEALLQRGAQAHPTRLQAGSGDVSTHYDPLKQAAVAMAVLCLAAFSCQYFCSFWMNLCHLRCRFLFCLPVCVFRHLLYFTVSSSSLSAPQELF